MVTFIDRNVRDSVLQDHPLHQNQYAYQTGKSTETTLAQPENTRVECSETPASNIMDLARMDHLTEPDGKHADL
jgi:hypothetical protein